MKTMKTTIILFLAVCINVSFLSCTSNSSDDETLENPLIGKWQIYKYSEGEEPVTNECEMKSVIEFTSDNIFKNDNYVHVSDDCILSKKQGTWVDKGNNVLEIVIEGKAREGKYYFENGNLKMGSSSQEVEMYTIYKRL